MKKKNSRTAPLKYTWSSSHYKNTGMQKKERLPISFKTNQILTSIKKYSNTATVLFNSEVYRQQTYFTLKKEVYITLNT